MQAFIDIENSQTKHVDTIEVPIIEFKPLADVSFDLSNISEKERELLKSAIDSNKPLTEIEMFFTEIEEDIPNFGPDFIFSIDGNIL